MSDRAKSAFGRFAYERTPTALEFEIAAEQAATERLRTVFLATLSKVDARLVASQESAEPLATEHHLCAARWEISLAIEQVSGQRSRGGAEGGR